MFVVSTVILCLRFHTFLLENILLLGVILVLIQKLEAFREIIQCIEPKVKFNIYCSLSTRNPAILILSEEDSIGSVT